MTPRWCLVWLDDNGDPLMEYAAGEFPSLHLAILVARQLRQCGIVQVLV